PAPHGRHRLEPDGRTDGGPRRRRGGEGPRDRHRRRTAVRLPGIIAVDVGGTKIRAGSVVDGVLGHVRTVPTPASAGRRRSSTPSPRRPPPSSPRPAVAARMGPIVVPRPAIRLQPGPAVTLPCPSGGSAS